MSSGITRPFGRLSQSPGYISDSLLTRSPLCIATPCDLHVLATPPAFRLSQDQTLQLNFVAPLPPHAPCDPDCLGLTGTDSFGSDVYPRNEFVQTRMGKTTHTSMLLPPSPARAGGSVERGLLNRKRRNSALLEQGSNIFLAYSNLNDRGRSLTCVHHKDV